MMENRKENQEEPKKNKKRKYEKDEGDNEGSRKQEPPVNQKDQEIELDFEPLFKRGYELELKGAYVLVKKTCVEKHGYVFGSIYKDGKKFFDIQVDNGNPNNGQTKKGYRWRILELVSTPSLLGQSWTRKELCMIAENVISAYSSMSALIEDNSVSALVTLQDKLVEFGLKLEFKGSADDLLMPGFPISITIIGLHITVDFSLYSKFNNFMNNLVKTLEDGISEDCAIFLGLDEAKHKKRIKYHQLVWNFVNELLNRYATGWEEVHLNLARVILFTLVSDQVNPVYLKKLGNTVNNGKDVYGIIIKNNLKRLYELIDPEKQKGFLEIVNILSVELSKKEEGIIQKFILDIVTSLSDKVSLYENIEDCLTESGKINFPKDKNIQEQISWIEQEINDPELDSNDDSINIKNDRLFGAYGIRCFGEKEDGERGYDIFENFNGGVVNNDKCRGIGLAESLDGLLGGQLIGIPIVAELRFCRGIRCKKLKDKKLVEKLYKHLSGIEEYIEKWM